MMKGTCEPCGAKKTSFLSTNGTRGGKLDIHSLIGQLPKPKSGQNPPDYKYMGPYNSLNKQLEYDKNTGEVLNWLHKIKKKVDEIVAHHDICYDMANDKGVCDRKMVSQLSQYPTRICVNGVWKQGQ